MKYDKLQTDPMNLVKIARKGYTDSHLRISSGQREARIHETSPFDKQQNREF
jgi:hypothetical protein